MIKNLTPHKIILPICELEPYSDVIPRCKEMSINLDKIEGIEIIGRSYGEVENLPEPEKGVFLIVSSMIRLASPKRNDLLSPGDLIRDKDGQIIGAKNLIQSL